MTTRSIHRTDRRLLRKTAGAAVAVVAATGVLAWSAPSEAEAKVWPEATVHADGGLNTRSAPSVHAPKAYLLEDGAKVKIDCQISGSLVDGNHDWYLMAAEGEAKWMSGRYLDVQGAPATCGSVPTISAVTTAKTGAFQGPSTQDRRNERLKAGETVAVYCYTDTAPDGRPAQRWVAAEESGWIKASKIDADKELPYCSQA